MVTEVKSRPRMVACRLVVSGHGLYQHPQGKGDHGGQQIFWSHGVPSSQKHPSLQHIRHPRSGRALSWNRDEQER